MKIEEEGEGEVQVMTVQYKGRRGGCHKFFDASNNVNITHRIPVGCIKFS